MELFLTIVGLVVLSLVVAVIKDMDARAQERRDDRVMTRYRESEDARYHQHRLADIDRTVQATIDELDRIAAETRGEIIEGTCREVKRR